jgi:hypothetical protein
MAKVTVPFGKFAIEPKILQDKLSDIDIRTTHGEGNSPFWQIYYSA